MPRTNISDILKNGENFKLKRYKPSERRTKKILYFQRLAEGRKYLDWHKLSKMYFGISSN